MANNNKKTEHPPQVTTNAHDIGYVLGKVEMIEKKFDEHRTETRLKDDEIMTKLDEMSQNMSFWRYTLWLLKALAVSLPLIVTANFEELLNIWKGD